MNLILSFRNVTRNPRRTLVILLAVLIGVWNMVVLAAITRGMEKEMAVNAVSNLTGSVQIHHPAYTDDPSIENSMEDRRAMDRVLARRLSEDASFAHRIRVNAVAANARHSSSVTLVGIEPAKEAGISFIGKAVVDGRYLKPDDTNAILVGRSLLKTFDTKIGNRLILMSQDRDNTIASMAFRITGVFRADMESTEKQFVFVPIASADAMLKLGGRISETAVRLKAVDLKGRVEERLAEGVAKDLGKAYSVKTWRDLIPMMKAYLDMNDYFLYIWYVVVFVAMGFGVVNTTLMAVYERMKEFGLMKALGMTPTAIVVSVLLESAVILALGVVLGNLLGFATVVLLGHTGIDLSALAAGAEMWGLPRVLYPEIALKDVAAAGGVVMVLGVLVSLYPALKAARVTPVEAMNMH
jgi:ABC-type lipoprotein release transport system permease subunit